MTMRRGNIRVAVGAGALLVAVMLGWPAVAAGQDPVPKKQARPMAPGEVQRLFEAYTIRQAQQMLGLSDEKFAVFLPRLRDLQQTRRRHDQARQQLIGRLRRLANAEPPNETEIAYALQALTDLDGAHATKMQGAYSALDETLDLRQRARFRLFEQQMERRKFDLIVRARRGDAP